MWIRRHTRQEIFQKAKEKKQKKTGMTWKIDMKYGVNYMKNKLKLNINCFVNPWLWDLHGIESFYSWLHLLKGNVWQATEILFSVFRNWLEGAQKCWLWCWFFGFASLKVLCPPQAIQQKMVSYKDANLGDASLYLCFCLFLFLF